ATSFTAEGLPERLPAEIETALYRITQEALTNVAKHAAAHRVRVTLVREGGELRLEIADDGHGLPAHPGGTRPGTGLVGIRERVHALADADQAGAGGSEEHTSELQSRFDIVCRLLRVKKTSPRDSKRRHLGRSECVPLCIRTRHSVGRGAVTGRTVAAPGGDALTGHCAGRGLTRHAPH